MLGLRRGRLRWVLLALVLVVTIVRLSLPWIVRKVIVSQASRALHTRVNVGAIDLSFWQGRVGIHDVAIHAPSEARVAEPNRVEEPALLGWKLLEVELAYRPLFHKLVRLNEVVLDTPRVALDRLADGGLNLQRLVPQPSEPTASLTPPAEGNPKTAWGFALDRLVLRGGGLRFRDLLVPQSQPLDAVIPAIEVADVAFQPGLYDQPAHMVLDIRSEGSRVRLDAHVRMLERGISVEASVDATNLPLRRARVYVPGVGWSDLQGFADASLRYRLETAVTNEVRGMITVRALEVRTPHLDQSALAWESLAVHLEPIDLLQRTATVKLVELKGASVVASLQGGEVLPLIAGRKEASKTGAGESPPPSASPPPAPATAAPAAASPPAKPWRWRVAEMRVEGSNLVMERVGPPLPVAVTFDARDLASEPDNVSAVDLHVKIGSGTIDAAGKLRLFPPAFGGAVHYAGVDVRELVPVVPSVPQKLVQSAVLGGELVIEAGIDAASQPTEPAGTLRLRGRLQVDKLSMAANDPKAFAIGWKQLEVKLDEVSVPGALGGAPPGARVPPIRVAVSSVRLDDPWARLTRLASGIVLPEIGTAKAAAKAPAKAPAPASAQAPASAPDVTVKAVDLRGGRVSVVDRTVKPFFSGDIKPIKLEARDVRSKGPAIGTFHLSAAGFQEGAVDVSGTLRNDGGGTVDINGKRLGLTPFNPYVVSASSYSLGSGSLSITSKVTFAKDHYDTQNRLTIHDLGLQGEAGDTLFQQQFGIPLSTALALLTDLHGDISLDVPVAVDKGAAKIDLATVIGGALKSAVVGAVLSPLKIFGAVAGLGEKVGSIEPPPIVDLPGRAEPSPEGLEQVGQLADFLASRPGVAISLSGQLSAEDLRWIREQKLRAKIEAGPGIVGAITGLPAINARKRILQALVDRAAGKPGDISPDDAKRFEDWLNEIPPVPLEEIRALAKQRAERVAALLRDDHGIDERRLRTAPPDTVSVDAAKPGVKIALARAGA